MALPHPYQPQPRPRQGNNDDDGDGISSIIDGLSSILGSPSLSVSTGTPSLSLPTGTSTRTRTRTSHSLTDTSATETSSTTDTSSPDNTSTSSALPTSTDTNGLTSSSPTTSDPATSTHAAQGPSSAIAIHPTSLPASQTAPDAVSSGSSIFTSVLVTTSATVSGHLTVFSTLVPTTLSAFPTDTRTSVPGSAIAGIVVGVLLVVALLVVLALLFKRRRRNRRNKAALIDAARSSRKRGIVLDDDEEAEIPMRLHNSAGSSREMAYYPYGSVGGPPPSPGQSQHTYSYSMQEGMQTSPMDAFAGKDPAQIRALKASRTGSASGSIFREDFGDGAASPTPSRSLPSPHNSWPPHERWPSTGSTGPLVDASSSGPAVDTANMGNVRRTESPSPVWSPRSNPSPLRNFSPPGSTSPPNPPSAFQYPPFPIASSSSSLHHPPPGAASAMGPEARNSILVDGQFNVRDLDMQYAERQQQQQQQPPQHPRRRTPPMSRRSTDSGGTASRRDSYVLPELPVSGDGSMRRRERGSSIDIKPYLSDDEEGAARKTKAPRPAPP